MGFIVKSALYIGVLARYLEINTSDTAIGRLAYKVSLSAKIKGLIVMVLTSGQSSKAQGI